MPRWKVVGVKLGGEVVYERTASDNTDLHDAVEAAVSWSPDIITCVKQGGEKD